MSLVMFIKQHSCTMWICKRYNWRWRSARFSWVAEKLSIFVGTEQTAVVLYIGGFRHQSWLWLGGAENNGLHIFHCISIALYLCISSLCDLYLYVFCICIRAWRALSGWWPLCRQVNNSHWSDPTMGGGRPIVVPSHLPLTPQTPTHTIWPKMGKMTILLHANL